MLDVHPPHEKTHSWTDFFIHIATIVVGLIIAVGLEQAVEAIHHHHQLQEARAQLAEERDLNRRVLIRDANVFNQEQEELAEDLAVLRGLERDPSKKPSASLHYATIGYATHNGAWQSAIQTGVVGLMSNKELQLYSYRYDVLAAFREALIEGAAAMQAAKSVAGREATGPLTPVDIHELILATNTAQAKLVMAQTFLGIANQSALQDALDPNAADRPVPNLKDLP